MPAMISRRRSVMGGATACAVTSWLAAARPVVTRTVKHSTFTMAFWFLMHLCTL